MAEIVAVCVSEKKGTGKTSVGFAELRPRHGLVGDAHAGDWHRQVSLLALESVQKAKAKGLDVKEGDFAENLTTLGIELHTLPVGTRLAVSAQDPLGSQTARQGDSPGPRGEACPPVGQRDGARARRRGAVLEVTQIGKVCHTRCAVYRLVGDCVMPREGIFARVVSGGEVRAGDRIEVDNRNRIAILTASDKGARGEREDRSSDVIRSLLSYLGAVSEYAIVPDEKDEIAQSLRTFADESGVDLIVTTGGTGLGPRDMTPEATLEVVDREVPGLAEAMRTEGLRHTPRAALSRAVAGIRSRTLIVNLPGSPKGVSESLSAVLPALPHALEILRGIGGECAATEPPAKEEV